MMVFHNAAFVSCDQNDTVHRVLIEKTGDIVFAGDHIPIQYQHWPRTDLRDRCVIPAFADTHMHFESFALFHSTLDVRSARDFDELAALIRTYIDRNPNEKVILGFGCSPHTACERRLPHLIDLDKITELPLMLIKYDGHAAMANTAMIMRLPKQVFKEKGFVPEKGWFFQASFYRAVNFLTRSVSLFKVLKNMIRGADHLARKGIALVHTTEGVGFPLDMDVRLMRFAARGLPQFFRVYYQTLHVKKALKQKLATIGGCFETALDGCFGSQDAALRAAYSNQPHNRGVLFYNQAQVTAFVEQAHRSGLQVSMHAIGDAAIAQGLTAYEKALSTQPPSERPHVLIHADLMTPDLIDKAAGLNIAIALQTPFLMWPEEPIEYLSELLGDRIQHLIPLKSMLSADLLMGNGSGRPLHPARPASRHTCRLQSSHPGTAHIGQGCAKNAHILGSPDIGGSESTWNADQRQARQLFGTGPKPTGHSDVQNQGGPNRSGIPGWQSLPRFQSRNT
jgi:predicted amidohydrolase YtcJ